MATYLLVWNPTRWEWHNIEIAVQEIEQRGFVADRWSCGRNKNIHRDDRVFLIRLGRQPKGIVGSGVVENGSFEALHWEEEKARQGITSQCVNVRFDTLLNADAGEPILSRDWLKSDVRFSQMHWDSQSSGVRIPDGIAVELEAVWGNFSRNVGFSFAEEVPDTEVYFEGTRTTISINRYERSSEARARCIEYYDSICAVCGFDFGKIYGRIGQSYIHVHHLKPLSEIDQTYQVDPIQDLRPVCANCHAMLHRRRPSYSIEELRQFLNAGYQRFLENL